MSTAALYSVLASGVTMTGVLGIYDRIRNRKFDKRKQDTSVKLDQATYDEIASRAAQTNSSNLMAVGSFWQGQFNELAKQVEGLESWRRRAKDRWHEHYIWDQKMVAGDPDPGPPPSLDPDE